jgi:hypothetical protein
MGISGVIYQNPVPPGTRHLDGHLQGCQPDGRRRLTPFSCIISAQRETPPHSAGVKKHLEALTSWLDDESAPQYVLMVARAGLGKSALLAHWVDALQRGPTDCCLLYFPIKRGWRTNLESAVFSPLAPRLARLFGQPAPQTEDVRQLREVLQHYLDRAVKESRRLLLIVDGLDKAAGWVAGTDCLPPRSHESSQDASYERMVLPLAMALTPIAWYFRRKTTSMAAACRLRPHLTDCCPAAKAVCMHGTMPGDIRK